MWKSEDLCPFKVVDKFSWNCHGLMGGGANHYRVEPLLKFSVSNRKIVFVKLISDIIRIDMLYVEI